MRQKIWTIAWAILLAAKVSAVDFAQSWVAEAGTVAVLDFPNVQSYLTKPSTSDMRKKILQENGFLLKSAPKVLWLDVDSVGKLQNRAEVALGTNPELSVNWVDKVSEDALDHISLWQRGQHPNQLAEFFLQQQWDAVVVTNANRWRIWTPIFVHQGNFSALEMAIRADILQEEIMPALLWPEAEGNLVIQVSGVKDFNDLIHLQNNVQRESVFKTAKLMRVYGEWAFFSLDKSKKVELESFLKDSKNFSRLKYVGTDKKYKERASKAVLFVLDWNRI
jgi:hypothetical protein